jgi:Amt family ammonium transporter
MTLSKLTTKLSTAWLALGMTLAPAIAFAQETTTPAAPAAAPVPDKGDIAFMYIATLLVLLMIVPGLALFYGGLMRAKNMLSILMQVTMIGCVVMLVWAIFGYSMAFGGGTNPFYGGFAKAFMMGMTPASTSSTFTKGVVIPEYLFFLFQMTFAAITPCLIIGAFGERIKFSASVLFCTLWTIFVYFPVAHMVWDANGLLFSWGALDFAGGTVVHINAGVSGLVGAIMVGKRIGFGKDMMAPHSITMTFIGAGLLWVGWFGFNAGSNLEASGGAMIATMNTFLATAAATVSWSVVEKLTRGKASMLGAASGMIAGLVAITPASGIAGSMGAIVMGLLVSPLCYFFVSVVKNRLGYDDTADVFGVHGIGGMFGAVATGIFASASLGGVGYVEGVTMAHQVWVQIEAVVITILWTGIGSIILYKVVDMVVGLRVTPEAEREGLDLSSHGEAAYHNS